jgi:hypothetical protein
MSHILSYNEDDLKATEMRFVLGDSCYNFWYPTRIDANLRHPIYPEFSLSNEALQGLLKVPGLDREILVEGTTRVFDYRKPAPLSPVSAIQRTTHRYPNARVKTPDDYGLGSNNWAATTPTSSWPSPPPGTKSTKKSPHRPPDPMTEPGAGALASLGLPL